MPSRPRLWFGVLIAITSAACSVVSPQVKSSAISGVPFPLLVKDVDRYRGATVILGGYVLETENLESTTVIRLLQAPLNLAEEPGPREDSLGRFEVSCNGFLDPELYRKDRRLTVAGKVTGVDMRPVEKSRVPYLQLQALEVHLWREYPQGYAYPYFYYDPFYYDPWFDGWYAPYYRRYHHHPRHSPRHPPRPRPPPRPEPG